MPAYTYQISFWGKLALTIEAPNMDAAERVGHQAWVRSAVCDGLDSYHPEKIQILRHLGGSDDQADDATFRRVYPRDRQVASAIRSAQPSGEAPALSSRQQYLQRKAEGKLATPGPAAPVDDKAKRPSPGTTDGKPSDERLMWTVFGCLAVLVLAGSFTIARLLIHVVRELLQMLT